MGVLDPDIGRHLLRDEGEVIVDEVLKHWVAYVRPLGWGALAFFSFFLVLFMPVSLLWLPFWLGAGLAGFACWRALGVYMDRFVVTNMRVFRVKGVFQRSLATMPLTRILDIKVVRPISGRVFGFGHFTFESAAQDTGLRDIRFVGRPNDRDLAIQRVVQRAGLRGPRVVN